MLLPDHQFVKPATLAESLNVLAAGEGVIKLLSGGTDVVFNMRGRLFRPDVLLSLKDLPELQFVDECVDGSLRIGTGCRLTDLERHPAVLQRPALAAAVRAVASRHVRNMATLGGNLCLDTRCWYVNQSAEWRAAKGPCMKTGRDYCHAIKSSPTCVALNASDIAPALIALQATVHLASAGGERELALNDFYTDDGVTHTVRSADEIMTAVTVPASPGPAAYIKETARKGNDFAYGTIAAHIPAAGGARIVIGALTGRPTLLREPARIVDEQGLGDAAIDAAVEATRGELGALTNLYTPAAYKSALARGLMRRVLLRLREQQA